ncbi:MAG: VirB4 family type IV secretion system protein, partial [Acutalibacteraceae bacterium]
SYGYKSAVFLNESKAEWNSMFQSYNEQMKTEFKRYGQPLLSEMIASGNPFHFTKLNDTYGTYLGYSSATYGSVLFDMFQRDNRRMSYNGLCVGRMGAGKSTLLKKLMTDMAARGNYIRGFDVTGEWRDMIEEYGGKIISLDGSQGILNALEVLKTGENDVISFNRHLSKLTTIYKFLVKDVDAYEIIEFEQLLKEFYQDYGLINPDKDTQLTGLPANSYPIWSDFLNYIKKVQKSADAKGKVQTEIEIEKQKRINNIRLVIQSLVDSYGHIFNGHTSIDNILDTQIVFFDIKNLANMKSEIFDAQMFTALLLCWDNCLKIGSQMKDLYDKNQIAWEDITRFMIFIDEAHRIINTNKLQAVEQLIVFEREARKFFGGLLYASQSIRDFVPEGSNQDSVDKIKTLFELTQYKFIMQQDSNCLDLLNNVFQYQLTESELQQIPSLEKGECILSISSDKNIQFYVDVTDEELELFRGGA